MNIYRKINSIARLLLLFTLLEFPIFCNAQQTTFFTILDYYRDMKLNSITQVADNGYILTGTAELRDQEIIIAKIDEYGYYVWSKFIGYYDETTSSYTIDEGINLLNLPEEYAFLVLGTTLNGDNTVILKYNLDGNLNWQQRYNIGYNTPTQISKTVDNGYIICGSYSEVNDISTRRPFLLKLDEQGYVHWKKDFNFSEWSESTGRLNSLIITADGDYLTAGIMQKKSTDNHYYAVVSKLDSYGNILWQKQYGEVASNFSHIFIMSNGDNYQIISEAIASEPNIVLTDIDANGNTTNSDSLSLGGLSFPLNIIKEDANYSFSTSYNADTSSCYFLRISNNGKMLQNKAFVNSNDYAYNIKHIESVSDNSYVVLSENYFAGDTHKRACVFKLDTAGECGADPQYGFIDDGNVTSINNEKDLNHTFEVKQLIYNHVLLKNNGCTNATFYFNDIMGRILLTGNIEQNSIKDISINNFLAGTYIINIVSDSGTISKKIVK